MSRQMPRRHAISFPSAIAMCGFAIVAASLFSSPAQAWNKNHHGKPLVCYKKVMVPAEHATVERQVLVRPGVEVRRPIAAVYGTRHRQVVVTPGYWEHVSVPATTRIVRQRVMVRPARTVWHQTAGTYQSVTTREVVRPAQTKWVKKGLINPKLCLVQVPAVTRMVTRKVHVGGKRVAQHIPAVYDYVEREVVVRGERSRRVWHPPVTRTVAESHVVQHARTEVITQAPVYATRQARVVVRPAGMKWISVPTNCE